MHILYDLHIILCTLFNSVTADDIFHEDTEKPSINDGAETDTEVPSVIDDSETVIIASTTSSAIVLLLFILGITFTLCITISMRMRHIRFRNTPVIMR